MSEDETEAAPEGGDNEMAAAMAEMDAAGGDEAADDDMAAAMAEMDPGGGDAAEPPRPGGDQAVYDVPVEISAVLGTTQIQISQLLRMGRGAVLELDRLVGDPIDIYIDKQMIGQGEVLIIEDKIGVTLINTIKMQPS